MKMGVIKQFLRDVVWGDLDYLVVDSPPGTGDEPLSVCQFIPNASGIIIVTTPQDVAILDARKSVLFAHELKIPVVGIVENMSGFICPHCQGVVDIFKKGGGEAMAERMGVSFLGRIPMTSLIVEASDDGRPFIEKQKDAEVSRMFDRIVDNLIGKIDGNP